MTYAAGTTYTWIGGTTGNWNNSANWGTPTVTNGFYPGQSGSVDAVIIKTNANITMPALAGSDVYTLTSFTISTNGTTATLTQSNSADLFSVSGTFKVNSSTSLTLINAQNFNFSTQTINGDLTLNNCKGIVITGTASASTAYAVTNGSQITFQNNFTSSAAFSLIGSSSTLSKLIVDHYNATFLGSFTNNGTGTFTMTDGEIDIIYPGAVFNNNGNMTVTNSSLTSFISCTNSNTIFSNTRTFNSSSTTILLIGDGSGTVGSQFQNTGAGIVNSTGGTFYLGGTNSSIINDYGATFNSNAVTFQLNGGENDANGTGATNSIYNGGIFNATNGSVFSMPYGNSANIFNGGSTWYTNAETPADTAFFILDPTSKISAKGSGSVVYNNYPNLTSNTATGVFILQSDINHSAYIEAGATKRADMPAIFVGQFYVQRFFTGQGLANYRGYRLISAPVNAVSPASGTSNYADFSYLNKTLHTGTNPTYPNNPVLTYYGIATGGTGTGFSIYNKNPLFYLYNETYNPVYIGGAFTASKYPGITDVNGTSLSWLSTSTGSNVTGTSQVPVGNGALIYYVGPNTRTNLSSSILPTNSTVSYLGYLNQGDITVYPWFTPGVGTLSYTSALPAQSFPGVNLVGNPYPAMIDLMAVAKDNFSGATTTFYELDDAGSQVNYTYASYVWDDVHSSGLTSGSNASQYIETGQGFFIKATSAGQALTFKEDQKVYDISKLNYGGSPAGVLALNTNKKEFGNVSSSKAIAPSSGGDFAGLHLMLKKDSTNYHETGIYFAKSYSDKLDNIDAPDLDGISIKTYLSSYTADGTRVAINGMGSYTSGKSVKLYVRGTIDGTYSLNLTDILNIDQTISTVNLIDNYKKDTVNLIQAKSYSFDILNADTNSYGSNRFILSVQRKPLAPYQLVAFTASKVNSNIAVTWQTNNEGNYTGFGLQKLDVASNKFITIDSLQSSGKGNYVFNDPSAITGDNTYRLAQNNIDGIVSYSNPITIKYGLLSVPKALSIFPNPVKDNALLDFSGLVANQNGNFEINIYNTLGVLLLQRTSTTNFLSTDLSSLKPGIYVVQVKSSNGNVLGKSTFIKN